jgi:hypothetical protein
MFGWLMGIDLVVTGLIWLGWKRTQIRMRCDGLDGKIRLPFIDRRLKALAGTPTKAQQLMAKTAIKTLKHVLKLQATEYFIMGMLNPNSPLREKMEKYNETH